MMEVSKYRVDDRLGSGIESVGALHAWSLGAGLTLKAWSRVPPYSLDCCGNALRSSRRLGGRAHESSRHSDNVLHWPGFHRHQSVRYEVQNDLHAGRQDHPRTLRAIRNEERWRVEAERQGFLHRLGSRSLQLLHGRSERRKQMGGAKNRNHHRNDCRGLVEIAFGVSPALFVLASEC